MGALAKTLLLMGVLTGLLGALGYLFLGGLAGLIVFVVLAAALNGFAYWKSDALALRMAGARQVTPEEEPRLHRIVEEATSLTSLPKPKVYIVDNPSPNAFATGRNPSHASVAFTVGILNRMNDNELEGVVAHELGHVLHRDILISSVAAMLAAAITMLARMAFWFGGSRDDEDRGSPIAAIAMMILAPIAAMLIQMAISRSREYDADAASAKYVGSPYPLIGGLQKLETWSKQIPMDASPATAHMFIIKPFTGQSAMRLFSTHPSTEDRIARLQAMR